MVKRHGQITMVLAIRKEGKDIGGHPERESLRGRNRRDGFRGNLFGVMISLLLALGACGESGGGVVTITAEEFRFTPQQIQWSVGLPLKLLIRNQGRERHVFHSPELFEKGRTLEWKAEREVVKQNHAIILEPGQSIELIVELVPGLYPFRCWIKGHKGMEGVILVDGNGGRT